MLAHISQAEIAPRATEEFFAQNGFERLNLRANGGLRDVEFGCGFRETAFPGNDPKISQMVVVQEFHVRQDLLVKSNNSIEKSY